MKRHQLYILLLSVIALSITACGGGGGGGGTDPGPTTYTISGRVVDINGNGVPGVNISIEAPGQSYPLTTSQSGTYSISFQTPATFVIRASLAGYDITPVSREVTSATLTATPSVSGIDFSLDSVVIRFNPPVLTIPGVNQTGTLVVAVDEVTDLVTATFTVLFDPAIIEVTEVVTSAAGYLLIEAGGTVVSVPPVIDNEAGSVAITLGAFGDGFTGASGSGNLAGITVRSKQAGSSDISFKTGGAEDLVLSRYPQNGGVPENEVVLPYTATVTVNP